MKRLHPMPFGAVLEKGRGVFRLWAPAARTVALRREEQERDREMIPGRNGWFHLTLDDAKAGDRYRFVIDGGPAVPDPASRFQPDDVDGPSELIDPEAFDWTDDDWRGRSWRDAVLYELHIGTFTAAGSFAAATGELERLARLGITAVELMPLADFAGSRNWGYDGVLLFAPDSAYGRPEDLKRFIAEAHRLGLMVLIDVVYNHFGPEGNCLPLYAPAFFAAGETAWGRAVDHRGEAGRFFIDNALYWLEEYHADGLRLDAVHAIADADASLFLQALAAEIRDRTEGREIHLVLENDRNEARHLRSGYDAQWNDDFHHCLHVILTGETGGCYGDYAAAPIEKLGRALTQGFVYQGEISPFRGAAKGEASRDLPPWSFVNFLQNHDQIGNRAFGERLRVLAPPGRLAAATAILLLAPSPPLLFMGEEAGAREPFLFFCDFAEGLAEAVRQGRQREFARFPSRAEAALQGRLPDPLAPGSFRKSRIDGAIAAPDPEVWTLYRDLLAVRRREIIPLLHGEEGRGGSRSESAHTVRGNLLSAGWRLPGGSLVLDANLSDEPVPLPGVSPSHPAGGRLLWGKVAPDGMLSPWMVLWRSGA